MFRRYPWAGVIARLAGVAAAGLLPASCECGPDLSHMYIDHAPTAPGYAYALFDFTLVQDGALGRPRLGCASETLPQQPKSEKAVHLIDLSSHRRELTELPKPQQA